MIRLAAFIHTLSRFAGRLAIGWGDCASSFLLLCLEALPPFTLPETAGQNKKVLGATEQNCLHSCRRLPHRFSYRFKDVFGWEFTCPISDPMERGLRVVGLLRECTWSHWYILLALDRGEYSIDGYDICCHSCADEMRRGLQIRLWPVLQGAFISAFSSWIGCDTCLHHPNKSRS
jgi:hypothetical protein